jgi:SAM-dependent methyltransferase
METIYDKIDPEEYEERYDKIPHEIYLRQHWLPIISDFTKRYCVGKDVLDLGCGYGKYIGIIKKYAVNVMGLDVSERWLSFARKKYTDVNFILGDIQEINLDKKFDVIFSIGLFEYVDRKIVMEKICNFIKPGGYCIISVPNKYSPTRFLSRIYHKLFSPRRWPDEPSKSEMKRLFLKNGFEIIELKMDDGLIWLPGFIDKVIGAKVYLFVEKIARTFGNNSFSNIMLFVVKKSDIS